MSLAAGTKLGRYEIRSKLGQGGMGEVYLAQDTRLDRKVALKILRLDVVANPDRMRRFVQEAKAASALNHPNIVTIHEIDQADQFNSSRPSSLMAKPCVTAWDPGLSSCTKCWTSPSRSPALCRRLTLRE